MWGINCEMTRSPCRQRMLAGVFLFWGYDGREAFCFLRLAKVEGKIRSDTLTRILGIGWGCNSDNIRDIDRRMREEIPMKCLLERQIKPAIILALFVFAVSLHANVLVRGSVSTTSGAPVRHALVQYINVSDTSHGFSTLTDSLGQYVVAVTGVVENERVDHDFYLSQNYPNPFSRQTTIEYTLKKGQPSSIELYDVLGRRVRTYQGSQLSQSNNKLQWDGTDDAGGKVAYGVYFFMIQGVQGTQAKKMIYLSTEFLPSISFAKTVASNVASIPRAIQTDTYKIYIGNTYSTEPKIEPITVQNVVLRGDTVINLQVHELLTAINEVHLQNQIEHSGIMVRLIELDKFVITDSNGHFEFNTLPDGNYTIEAKYPYFSPEKKTIQVQYGKVQTEVSLELKQQLQFWIQPPETTVSMGNLGSPYAFSLSGFRQYRVNLTDVPVTVGTYVEPQEFLVLVPQGFEWPYIANPDSLPDYCYREYGWMGGNDLIIDAMHTFQPEDTTSFRIVNNTIVEHKECFRAGDYFIYSAVSDLGHYPQYFDPVYVLYTPNQPLYYEMNRSVTKKRNLFRPAIIHLTN